MSTTIYLDIETTGLSAYADRITCIGLIVENEHEIVHKKTYCSDDEKQLLSDFIIDYDMFIEMKSYISTLTWNGEHFDVPFIEMRCLKHELVFDIGNHFDLRTAFPEQSFPNPTAYNKFATIFRRPALSEVLKFLDIPAAKTGDGKTAIELFNVKRYAELQSYCLQDVELVRLIWNRYFGNFLKDLEKVQKEVTKNG